MKIANKPTAIGNFKFNFYKFPAAREALAKIISVLITDHKRILIPAFIGYSSREGSGIFDPIRKSKIDYHFYRMDESLNIDFDHLKNEIINNPGSIVLLVHYWGFIDPKSDAIRLLAKQYNCIVVEDYAHGLFTFFNNPIMECDYGFFSLHKMFHYSDGGVLFSRQPMDNLERYDLSFFEYNLAEIIKIRISNYNLILAELKKINNPSITILRNEIGLAVPQTFPILLRSNKLKDFLYFKLNEVGFGVVSLYYQLISEVDDSFVNEKNVSARILNLPIHQDATSDRIIEMILLMNSLCHEFKD